MTIQIKGNDIYIKGSSGRMVKEGELLKRDLHLYRNEEHYDGKYDGFKVPMNLIESSKWCDNIVIHAKPGVVGPSKLKWHITRDKAIAVGFVISKARRELLIPIKEMEEIDA